MKSFLLYDNKPVCKWGMIPDNTFFVGKVPEGYSLAVAPSDNIIILDVDMKNGKNGYKNIPFNIFNELQKTFYYHTKSGGAHFWMRYEGYETLLNTSTKLGLDLRIGCKKDNCGGYVKYNHDKDIRECIHLIKDTSNDMCRWLESLFTKQIKDD